MEAPNVQEELRNDGQNLRSIRRKRRMNQDVLAEKVKMSQQTISRYEQMEIIEDEILDKFAKALGVTAEYIKEYQDDPVSIVIENNTFENNDKVSNIGNYMVEDNSTNNFNPIDKIVELFEKLLDTEKEKVALLEKLLKDKK